VETCDVLIVGGGPAGSTCAWRLKRAGYDVLVMDKSDFPRDKICAGWVTPQVIEELELDVEHYGSKHTFQPITGFVTGVIDGASLATDYERAASYGIRRCEFDHYLLQRSGARLATGRSLASLVRGNGDWRINDSIRAAMLVGAGGHFCPVARHLGAELGRDEHAITAQEVEFELTVEQAAQCDVRAAVPELYFCADLKGYAWAFRKGDYLNVGLGREDNHRLAEHMEAFCRFLRDLGKLPQELPKRFKGHAYLLYGRTQRTLVGDGVLVIGDAAGLAYPQSGEGIRPAIESALIAAKVIESARPDYELDALRSYQTQIEGRFGPRAAGRGALSFVPANARNFIGRKLLNSRWFARHVVLDKWFLHAAQPALEAR